MNAPSLVTTGLLSLSDAIREEVRLVLTPNKTDAEKARLSLLQQENALKAAGQDECHPRTHYKNNFHDL